MMCESFALVEKCRREILFGNRKVRRSMPIWKEYTLPHSLQEALQSLAEASPPACIVAGGTDLLLDLQQNRHPPVSTLVDVTQIPELNVLELRQERLFIGAAVPLVRILSSRLAQQHAQALVEACSLIGGPQVRNTATLGGNVAHALPAADGAIALLALRAQVEIVDQSGSRFVSLDTLYQGPGQSSLRANQELLVGFSLPLAAPGEASAFQRVMRPQGVALPILNLAVWLQRSKDKILDLCIAVGPAGPIPYRAAQAEAALRGMAFTPQALKTACQALLDNARFRTSPQRATQAYRRHLADGLLRQVMSSAWERAGDSLAA